MSTLKKETKLLARHSVIYGIGNLLNKFASILLLPVYTRFLTPTDYGINELVGLSMNIISILLSTSISTSIYRFYYEYKDENDRNQVVSTAIITLFSLNIIIFLCLCPFTGTMAKYILDSEKLYLYFIISLMTLVFQSVVGIGYNYLRVKEQSLKYTILSSGKLLFAISLNIYFIVFLKLGVLGILLSTLITSIVMFIIVIIPILLKTGLTFSYNKLKEMMKFGLPIIPAQFGAFLVHLSDRFFIKEYISIADAGLYSLGYKIGNLPGNFVASPFNQIWAPRRYQIIKDANSSQIFGQILTYFLFIMIFCGLFVSCVAKEIIMIMADSKFWSAYAIVPYIVIAGIIFNLNLKCF